MKEKLMQLAKDRGLDIAEETLENLCHLGVDIVEVLVKETETPIDDMVFASVEAKAREAIDKIDLDKDGE